jgi:hypothetical protein
LKDDNMLLMLHINKCGGKSFRAGLESSYGDALQLYYNNPIKKLRMGPVRRNLDLFVRKFRGVKVKESCEVIYGHYCLDEFSHLSDPATRRGTFFRDPVEWVGSFLFYNKMKHPDLLQEKHLQDIRSCNLKHGFASFLGSVPVTDLDFVRITEDYDNSLKLFQKIFGKEIPAFERNVTNKSTSSYRSFFEEQGILAEVEELMSENMTIYSLAVERYRLLCTTHGLQPGENLPSFKPDATV